MCLYLLGALFVIRGLLAENLLSTGIDYSIDPCILKVVECGELRIQLSPFRVTGIVVFNTKSDLKKSCSYGKKFFSCMEDAEELCKHRPTVYDRITENREFALSVCDDEGTWRKWYIENAYCINHFSIYILDVCAMSTIKKISEEFERGTTEFICQDFNGGNRICLANNFRFYVEIRKCRTSMTQKYCGVVAGEVLRKVLLYHRDYDFMCARVEKELAYFSKFSPAPDIEKFLSSPKTSPTPDILTNTHEDKEQEFENTNLHRIGSTVENEETSALSTEKFATETVPNEMEILSSNPVIPKNDLSATKSTPYLNPDPSLDATDALSDLQSIFVQKDPSAEEHFSFQKNHYSSVKENEYSSLGVELFVLNTSKQLHHTLNSRRKILSSFPYQDYATELATFGLYETIDHGVQYYLGCGYAVVSRTKSSLLNNTYCIWTKYLDQEKMFKCSVHIAEACIFEADDLGSVIFDLEYKTSLLIYDIVDGIHRKKASIFAQYYKPNTKVFPPGHISCRMLPKKALVS